MRNQPDDCRERLEENTLRSDVRNSTQKTESSKLPRGVGVQRRIESGVALEYVTVAKEHGRPKHHSCEDRQSD